MNTSLDPSFVYDLPLVADVIAVPSGRLLLPSEVKSPVNVFAPYRCNAPEPVFAIPPAPEITPPRCSGPAGVAAASVAGPLTASGVAAVAITRLFEMPTAAVEVLVRPPDPSVIASPVIVSALVPSTVIPCTVTAEPMVTSVAAEGVNAAVSSAPSG